MGRDATSLSDIETVTSNGSILRRASSDHRNSLSVFESDLLSQAYSSEDELTVNESNRTLKAE